jgi:hypothetical protein
MTSSALCGASFVRQVFPNNTGLVVAEGLLSESQSERSRRHPLGSKPLPFPVPCPMMESGGYAPPWSVETPNEAVGTLAACRRFPTPLRSGSLRRMSRPLKAKGRRSRASFGFPTPRSRVYKGCLRGRTADVFAFLPMRGVSYDFSCEKRRIGISAVPEKSFTSAALCSALSRSCPAVYFPAYILFR